MRLYTDLSSIPNPVYTPTDLKRTAFDKIYISSMYLEAIRNQLIDELQIVLGRIDYVPTHSLGIEHASSIKLNTIKDLAK